MRADATHEELERGRWKFRLHLAKYHGDWTPEQIDAGEAGDPYDVIEDEGNLLLIGGVSVLWECLIGNGGAGALAYFNNTNARLKVGNSSTAVADTQTDLQGGSKTPKAMDATYPQHTDSTGTAGSKQIVFRSTFGSGDGNHAWDEVGIDNGTRMLNRKVIALGTKATGTWVLTGTVDLA